MSEPANILLVDDEPGMQRYIRTLLEVDNYKVETASTGEEALEREVSRIIGNAVCVALDFGRRWIGKPAGLHREKFNRPS